jgi:hypothetical protein
MPNLQSKTAPDLPHLGGFSQPTYYKATLMVSDIHKERENCPPQESEPVEEEKEGGVGTKQKSLQNTGYYDGKAFQKHEGVYSSAPLFSFTQKAHNPSFVGSNRYTTKAFEYSQVAKTSNFATAMARGLKPLDPFLPPSPLGKSHTKTIIIIIIISSRPHTQHKITSA